MTRTRIFSAIRATRLRLPAEGSPPGAGTSQPTS